MANDNAAHPAHRAVNLSYFRGRLVRDAHIGDRKDDSGDKYIMGRIRCSENITDRNGESRTIDQYVEIAVFKRDDASALVAAAPKANAVIEIKGRVQYRERSYTDNSTGEVKNVVDLQVTASDDQPEHFARLL